MQKDKTIFKLDELPVERFAEALGLPGMPKIKFLSKEMAKKRENASRAVANAESPPKGKTRPQQEPDMSDDSDDDASESSGESSDEAEEETHEASKETDKVRICVLVLTILINIRSLASLSVSGQSTIACSNARTKISSQNTTGS